MENYVNFFEKRYGYLVEDLIKSFVENFLKILWKTRKTQCKFCGKLYEKLWKTL